MPVRRTATITLALLLATSGCSRYAELRAVVDTHVGFMHLVRGMNTYTVEALRRRVTAADVPVLGRMLPIGTMSLP